ncbi:MAG: ExbD/TolR family protein [Gammaproteobacteria bacterium]
MSVTTRAAKRHRRHEAADLAVTAFMNLMVVLVPFLLITAVFSRMTILELNLPSSSQSLPETPQAINLEIVVRQSTIETADRGTGLLRAFPDKEGKRDYDGLAKFLVDDIKPRFPTLEAVTILVEPDVPYDTVVQVMDLARVRTVTDGPRAYQVELFPEISIGDAPMLGEGR